MGSFFSQGISPISLPLSIEAKQSLNQILFALQNEFEFWSNHSQNQVNSRSIKPIEHRPSTSTRSTPTNRRNHLDFAQSKHLSIDDLFSSSRLWKCQFCEVFNEKDSQICFECGSNKVNVYIPVNYDQHRTMNKFSSRENSQISTDDKLQLIQHQNRYRRSVLIAHKRQADEHIVLQHVDKLNRTCEISHQPFKDQHFPASSRSLFINGNSFSISTLSLLPDQQQNQLSASLTKNSILWLRPDQIQPEPWTENSRNSWTVFRDPNPNDVLQGSLGDCWFITALSVLAEEPQHLMKILVTREYNRQGIYCVRLCKDGEWTQVFIDDRLPCNYQKRLAFSQAHRKQLWVPLIEKALAKLHGSYESIIAGRCCEGLATVTGSPCETLILGRSNNPDDKNVDHDKIWLKLLNARFQRFLMCAMCSNNTIRTEEFEQHGLLNIHAYSLQDVKQSRDGKHRLVKLRNPWGGTYRWTGEWSDESRLWSDNPDLRRELLIEKNNKADGVFWMPFHSFMKFFECVDICKLRNDWYEVRDTANFYPSSKHIQAYKIKLTEDTELDLSLYRKINKNLRFQRSEVSLCIGVISMEEQSSGHFRIYSMPIVSQRGQHKFISVDGQLKKGIYFIIPLLINSHGAKIDNTNFSLAIHSSHPIDLERYSLPRRVEREFFIKFSIFYGDLVQTIENSRHDSSSINGVRIFELKNQWDGLILVVENRHPSKYVHFHFRCTVCENASISRHSSIREAFDVVPPNHRQIIVSITRKNPSNAFTIGHDFEYQISSQNYMIDSNGITRTHWPSINDYHYSDDIHRPQIISSAKQVQH